MDLLKKVKRTISTYQMLHSGDRVLVALSGGIDSMTLLEVLSDLQEPLDMGLAIAHLDHQMRPDSAEDAEFVRRVAAAHGLPAIIRAIDVPAYIRSKSCSSEEGAREVRYRFLEEAAQELQATVIALGHTRNDQVETFLMRLIRGAGVRGLRGIPPVRDRFVRPLIDCTREEISAFARERGLKHREDLTNQQLDLLRNRVRHELLPLLARYNPNIKEVICRTQQTLVQLDRYFDEMAEGLLEQATVRSDKRELLLSKEPLRGQSEMLKHEVLRAALRRVRGDLHSISAIHLNALLVEFERRRSGAQIELPDGWRGINQGDLFLLTHAKRTTETAQGRDEVRVYPVHPEGETILSEIGWRFHLTFKRNDRLSARSQGKRRRQFEVDLDYAKIRGPFAVRYRRRGDRFQPFGMRGRKKLQDFFVDEKVSRAERDRIPLLVDQQGIVWVVGWRLDETYKITPETEQILHISAAPLSS
jgi:tRNA(Ile)-lysidine synthase